MIKLRAALLLAELNYWLHFEAVKRSPRASRQRARAIAHWAGTIARRQDARSELASAKLRATKESR